MRNTIVNEAKKYLGVKEGSYNHKHIIDTYNQITPLPQGYKMSVKEPWCATFVSFVFASVKALDLLQPECSCGRMIEKAKTMGIWQEKNDYVPAPGDILLYDWDCKDGWPDHVGIVTHVGEYMEIIEGNYCGEVKLRGVRFNDPVIRGFICPKYGDKPIQNEVPEVAPEEPKQTYTVLDVSENQVNVDVKSIKDQGVHGLILRTITRSGRTDNIFESTLKKCVDNKMPFHVYKYSYSMSVEAARKEAYTVVELLKKNGIKPTKDVVVWFDCEWDPQINLGNKVATDIILAFCDTITAAGFGTGLYMGMYDYYDQVEHYRLKMDVWVARYYKGYGENFVLGEEPDLHYCPVAKGDAELYGWQYTSCGLVNGVGGKSVDMNVVFKPMKFPEIEVINIYAPVPKFTLIDKLNKVGIDSSYSNRAVLADLNGIAGYKGTAEQNELMSQLLDEGKLIVAIK